MTTLPNELHFILVDDNEIDLFFHDKLLRYQSISEDIHSFNSAEKALAYLATFIQRASMPETIILLDIQMPEMDGFEFLLHFEKFPPWIKSASHIIMVSSSLDFGDISRSSANPRVARLLKKPLGAEEISQTIHDIFSE